MAFILALPFSCKDEFLEITPTGWLDANKGLVLMGRQGRKFEVLKAAESGLFLQGQVEDLVLLPGTPRLIVAGINRRAARVFVQRN